MTENELRGLQERSTQLRNELDRMKGFNKFQASKEFQEFIVKDLFHDKAISLIFNQSNSMSDEELLIEIKSISLLQRYFYEQLDKQAVIEKELFSIENLINNEITGE
jgi:hypothetical protein